MSGRRRLERLRDVARDCRGCDHFKWEPRGKARIHKKPSASAEALRRPRPRRQGGPGARTAATSR